MTKHLYPKSRPLWPVGACPYHKSPNQCGHPPSLTPMEVSEPSRYIGSQCTEGNHPNNGAERPSGHRPLQNSCQRGLTGQKLHFHPKPTSCLRNEQHFYSIGICGCLQNSLSLFLLAQSGNAQPSTYPATGQWGPWANPNAFVVDLTLCL